SDLRTEVPRGLALRPDLGEQEPEDVLDELAVLHEAHRRDDHALLEDLTERPDRRRRPAADVHVVREVRDVPEQLALVPYRRDERDVVQVHTARKRLVRDEDVSRAGTRRAVAAS